MDHLPDPKTAGALRHERAGDASAARAGGRSRAVRWTAGLVLVVASAAAQPVRAQSAQGTRQRPGARRAGAAPTWALREERRAPKMPDAARYWGQLGATAPADAFVDGLLICRVGVASASQPSHFPWGGWHPPADRDWDTFNGPDLRFRFQFAGETLALYGPEDHWEMFISIPRVTLRRGDRVRVAAWDRDVMTDEFIGRATAVFPGQFPWQFGGRHVRFDCRGADAARARAWAAPWGRQLDAALDRIAQARPDPRLPGRGAPAEIWALQSNWRSTGAASFRYYAGFLGWRDDEVQQRLERYRVEVRRWDERARAAAP